MAGDVHRRVKIGSRFPALVNGLKFLDVEETSLSCEEEEMTEKLGDFRRQTGMREPSDLTKLVDLRNRRHLKAIDRVFPL